MNERIMSKHKHYMASLAVKDEVVIDISDDNKDNLIARAKGLIESTCAGATCSVKNTQTGTVVLKLKNRPIQA